ncbi:unnamed protein product [Linum tenue]|uniref:Uncharacterized protein n=1 Tax=Linum tenue TaxID=586396 RepID=A0AAV0HVC0_9ROSI|nr:unnamed protein product [Linum tenue]
MVGSLKRSQRTLEGVLLPEQSWLELCMG